MAQKAQMVLKAWLTRCPPEQRIALERFLPEAERQKIAELPPFEAEITAEQCSQGRPLNRVHWSWFLPTLKSYAPRDQKLFLSALDPHSAEQLKATLNIRTSLDSVTEMGKAYLQMNLLRSLTDSHTEILPIELFPQSPLNVLVSLGKKDLIRLINFLSLYDLCAELRQIVNTKTLKKIYSLLSREHQATLQTISAQMLETHSVLETHPFPRMGLDRTWDGEEESLHVLLHRKGLTRLGVALSGQNPDLIWTICHHLDIGRGGALLKLCGKEPVHGISEIAIQQVIDSVHLLTAKG
ncbi:MAG TPA: hypothetical protein VGO47_00440 [Chlamydiales bacterium]|jgi:hypothetical protein|nr:hypothetical protein [Chlamydiales bacterium]